MKKILVFTGAGISAESGVETFRTDENGLWYNHKVEDVATFDGWKRDKEKVLNFYNERRKQLKSVYPNKAHHILKDLEENYEVNIITQNVDDLHERAGSSNVIHLHGELLKSRSTMNHKLVYDQYGDIEIGDKCEKGSQLRPHVVWFGENLDYDILKKSKQLAESVDICIVIGTSMMVYPANEIPLLTKNNTPIYYIDPGDFDFGLPSDRVNDFKHYKETASKGLSKLINNLK